MNALNTQIYEEASEWIIVHRSDDLDAEARQRFDAWVRESPQHLRAYLEMSTIWEDVPTLQHDWNPSADELVARAREDSNVLPLGLERVPGTGGFGVIRTVPANEVIGTVPEDEEPTVALKSIEPLEALKASNEAESKNVLSSGGASVDSSGGIETILAPEPPLVSVEHVITVPASSSRSKMLTIAAAIIAVAGLATWFTVFHNVYVTDIGEQRTLALEDGSSVELNARTKIRVAYTNQTRTIELLQGQALFKVAKDPNRPFIVDSAGTHIRAVGTQFDVYKKTAGTQVTVVEGRVAVRAPTAPSTVQGAGVSELSREVPTADRGRAEETQGFSGASRAPNADEASVSGDTNRASNQHASHGLQAQLGEVLVSAGEQILIAQTAPELASGTVSASSSNLNAGTVPTTLKTTTTTTTPTPAPLAGAVRPANIEAATAWTQQRFVFDFTPLTEVAQEFNRYNHRPMKVECTASRTVPTTPTPAPVGDPCNFNISGSFSSTDPTLLLRFLREQPGIVVTETSDEIRISPQDTPNG